MADERLSYLFDRFLRDECSAEEKRELSVLVLHHQHEEQVRALLKEYWDQIMLEEVDAMPDEEGERILEKIIHTPAMTKGKVMRMRWKRIAIAASVLLAVAFGIRYFVNTRKQNEPIAAVTGKDIDAPSATKAMITLSNGRKVSIDSLSSISQNEVRLLKTTDGKIIYSGTTNEIIYNTLTNPRGSRVIDMQLADGSHVWLNAGSSITYPVTFIGNERNVSITGEAYFEIAHDAAKPFHVSKADMTVEVLGTHFNMNAYEDESDIRVTLLEGSVRVKNKQSQLVISPNQQAVVKPGAISRAANVNIQQVMAWKNGFFSFKDTDLETVMRQIATWYDVTVSYESGVPRARFTGEIERKLSLRQILDILTETRIHYRIDGKKLTIMK